MFPSKILGVLEDMLEKVFQVFQGIEAFGLLVKVNIVFQRRNEIGEPTDEDPTPAVLYPFVLMRPDLIFASRTREMIVSEITPRPELKSPQLREAATASGLRDSTSSQRPTYRASTLYPPRIARKRTNRIFTTLFTIEIDLNFA